MTNWLYNEKKHCGVDYSDLTQVEGYDSLHLQFRNYEKEFDTMIEFLEFQGTQEMSVIDLGCGTGALTLLASKNFKKVYAVDVSDAMIAQVEKKAASAGITNVDFYTGGFLSYNHKAQPVDAIITKHSFHHLPDFWKQIALFRMNKMLKINGILYICDVAFNLEPDNYKAKIDNWISGFENLAGKELRSEVETHIRDEYSTFDWVLEGMFMRAGFSIEKSRSSDGFVREYFCKKTKEILYTDD